MSAVVRAVTDSGELHWGIIFNSWEKIPKGNPLEGGWSTTLDKTINFTFEFTKEKITSLLENLYKGAVTTSGIFKNNTINVIVQEEASKRIKISMSNDLYLKEIFIFQPEPANSESANTDKTA